MPLFEGSRQTAVPHSLVRCLSRACAASALAFSNSLDLRPATAAAISGPASRARDSPSTPRTMALREQNQDGELGMIKQVRVRVCTRARARTHTRLPACVHCQQPDTNITQALSQAKSRCANVYAHRVI